MGGTQTGSGRHFLRKRSRVISSLTNLQKLNRRTMGRRKRGTEDKRKRERNGGGERETGLACQQRRVREVHSLHLEVDHCAEMRKGSPAQ